MSAAIIVVVLAVLVGVTILLFGLLWIIERRRPRRPAVTPTARPSVQSRPLTVADAHAIYRHFLATIGWTLFWFSGIGGTAGLLFYNSTDNRLDNPLVLVCVVVWGSLGAAVTLASRADLRRLR